MPAVSTKLIHVPASAQRSCRCHRRSVRQPNQCTPTRLGFRRHAATLTGQPTTSPPPSALTRTEHAASGPIVGSDASNRCVLDRYLPTNPPSARVDGWSDDCDINRRACFAPIYPKSRPAAFEAFDPIASGQQNSPCSYPDAARNIRTMVEEIMRFVVAALWGVTVVAVAVLGYLAY